MAESLGFCYGVKRAVRMAKESARPDRVTRTLGPIIHNPQVVAQLAKEGIGKVEALDEVKDGGGVIIRSHGVGPQIYAEAKARGIPLTDATCPHVKRAQSAAEELAQEGRFVVIVGEKRHPEVKSIFEWSGEKAAVVESEAEAKAITFHARLGIVAQTTFSGEKFRRIAHTLLEKSEDVRIVRTICDATDRRQEAAIRLAQKVDLMLVIGGKNSANTSRLAQLCAEKCQTHHIETATELRREWFDHKESIGITAGASTPDWIIEEVYQQCQKI